VKGTEAAVSTSIKPPTGSPGGAAGIEGAGDVADVADVADVSAGQAGRVGAADSASAAASASAAQSPTGTWLHKLASGEVTRAEAVEGLVAQAVEAQGGARLSPAQRSELEGLLRGALLEDPVLSRLLGGA
jgi:hypothetical protein